MDRRAAEQMNKSKPAATAMQKMDQSKQAADQLETNTVDESKYVSVFSHQNSDDAPGSPFMEALRPSIFTTVASLAERERTVARSDQGTIQMESDVVVVDEWKPYTDVANDMNDSVEESFETTVQMENDVVDESNHATVQVAEESSQGIHVMSALSQATIHPENDIVDESNHATFQVAEESNQDIHVMGGFSQATIHPENDVLGKTVQPENDLVGESNRTTVQSVDESDQSTAQFGDDVVHQDFSIVETHFSETH
jgi:hypothetical protein